MVFRVAGGIAGSAAFVTGNYAMFVSTANQPNGGATTANLVALDTNIRSSNINNNAGVMTFTGAGIYHIISELSFTSTAGANPTISTWLTQNGQNVAYTTQDFQLLGGANTVQLSTCSFILNVANNDNAAVYWACSDTRVSLAYQAALASPTRPASPSAMISITQV